jgi:hypothetical protein
MLSKNVKIRIYKAIILPVVLYGCETWSVILLEEHKLRVFENRVREGNIWTKEGWSDGRVENRLCSSKSRIRRMKRRRLSWADHVAHKEEEKQEAGKRRRKG